MTIGLERPFGLDIDHLIISDGANHYLQFPKLTTAQKNALVSPKAGTVVYDTDLAALCLYTTAWHVVNIT